MGMFDNLRCSAPLPGTPPEFIKPGHLFQTKDIECSMTTWEITADGRLVEAGEPWYEGEGHARRDDLDFTGDVNFYDNNGVGYSHGFSFTANGEDYESVTYCALFASGRLQQITEVSRTQEPALPRSEMERTRVPTANALVARKAREEREAESWLGRTVYRLRGWPDPKPEPAKVVFETEHERVLLGENDRLEVHDRRLDDWFDSPEEARAANDRQVSAGEQEKARLGALLQQRQIRAGTNDG
jgi:hypothetical protein